MPIRLESMLSRHSQWQIPCSEDKVVVVRYTVRLSPLPVPPLPTALRKC
jgi:hypothetical protein